MSSMPSKARASLQALPALDGTPHPKDLELVERALGGDAHATRALVERMRCIPRILVAKDRRMGAALGEHDLADLAQDVFHVVWTKLGEFAGQVRLEAWVGQFCAYTYMNAYRKRRARPMPTELLGDELVAPDAPEGHPVSKALGVLRSSDRRTVEIIERREYRDESFATIAAAMDMPVGTAKTMYYRGLERLRVLLRARYGYEEERT